MEFNKVGVERLNSLSGLFIKDFFELQPWFRKPVCNFIFILIVTTGTLGCTRSPEIREVESVGPAPVTDTLVNLSGKAMRYVPEFDSVSCRIYGECDCCSGYWIFISESAYIKVDICEMEEVFSSGSYSGNGDVITLKYDGRLLVRSEDVEDGSGTETTDEDTLRVREEFIEAGTTTLSAIKCGENVFYRTTPNEVFYGSFQPANVYDEWINQMQREGIIEKLIPKTTGK